jgi:hypothetical protein
MWEVKRKNEGKQKLVVIGLWIVLKEARPGTGKAQSPSHASGITPSPHCARRFKEVSASMPCHELTQKALDSPAAGIARTGIESSGKLYSLPLEYVKGKKLRGRLLDPIHQSLGCDGQRLFFGVFVLS